MRAIDADTLIRDIYALPNCYNGYSDTYDKDCIIGLIEEAPTIDAVEVVRCGKCYWWDCETKGCERNPSVKPWFDDDFCSYGERRTE